MQGSPEGSDRSIDLLDVAGRELDRVRYGRRSVGRLLPASPSLRPSLPLPVCDSIGVPLAVRRGKRLPRLSSLNKPEGDQWGGRAASTRSDNPARTEPESAGAPQPTPTRPNPKEGRRREAKGKLQRQQPFSVQLRSLTAEISDDARGANPDHSDLIGFFDREARIDRRERGMSRGMGTQGSLCSPPRPWGPSFWLRNQPFILHSRPTDVWLSEGGRSSDRREGYTQRARAAPRLAVRKHSSLALYPPNQTISALLATS